MPIFSQKGRNMGISRENPKKGHFCPFSGFLGFFRKTGKSGDRAPARGVDVKPPSRRGLGSCKSPKWGFWPVSAPLGAWGRPPGDPGRPEKGLGTLPGLREPGRGQGFYINPSRRGPVAPPGPRGPGRHAATARGKTPHRACGALPAGEPKRASLWAREAGGLKVLVSNTRDVGKQ